MSHRFIQQSDHTDGSSRRLIRLGGLTHHALGVVRDALSDDIVTGLEKLNRYFSHLGLELFRSQNKIFTQAITTSDLEQLDQALRSPSNIPQKLPQLVGCFFVLSLDADNKPVGYAEAKRVYLLDIGEHHQRVLQRFKFSELIPAMIAVCPDSKSHRGYSCIRLADLMPGYSKSFVRSYLNACGILLTYSIED